MSDQAPYTKEVRYLFKAGGERWAVTTYTDVSIEFEETRKNGQEDTHLYGCAALVDGHWTLDADTCECLRETYADDMGAAIEAHFDAHPLPKEQP